MNKKIFIYALSACVAASSLAYAQATRAGGPQTQGQAKASSPVKLGSHNFNGAQQILSDILVQEQIILIDTSTSIPQKQAVILEHCTARMWYMSKDQQDYEKFGIYDMDHNMPSPSKWDQVRNAKSMVKELLVLTPDQEAKINRIMNSQHADDRNSLTVLTGLDFVRNRLKGLMNRRPDVMNVLTAGQRAEWEAVYEKAHANMQRAYDSAGKP